MFNWLKKSLPISEKTVPKICADTPCDAPLTDRELLEKSVALKKQGNEFLAKGMLEEATDSYRKAVTVNPNYAEGLLNLGFVLRAQKHYEEAVRYLKRALVLNPELEDAYFILGGIAQECGKLEESIEYYKKVLELNPRFEPVYGDLYFVLSQTGETNEAKKFIEQAVSINPNDAEFQFCLGIAYAQEKNYVQAITCYHQALSIQPKYIAALCHLGNVYKDQGDLDEAQVNYHRALEINPNDADAHNNLGTVFQEKDELEKAEKCYRKAIACKPDYFEALNNLGTVLNAQGKFDEAIAAFHQANVIKPDSAEVFENLGGVFKNQGKLNEAVACYRKALVLKPNFPDGYNNFGVVLMGQGNLEEAINSYRQALVLKPDFSLAHNNLGVLFQGQGQLDKALVCYRQALECAPEFHEAKINLLHVLQHICEWKDLLLLSEEVRCSVRESPATTANPICPFSFLAMPGSTASEQKICASNWARKSFQLAISRREKMGFEFKREPKRKINLAYLSADFKNHPVAILMAEIFDLHDRNRFQISAYSYGADDGGLMRKRLEKSFDQFIDIRALPDEVSAKRIYEDRIDILVDLTGYTQHSRSAILALHPAPIQVNYLGYPGTMGTDFIDYLIADQFVIPSESRALYTEKVVWLPDCYMPRDTSCGRLLAPSRKDCGLPEDGFVFCCFNLPYKITPDMFDVWCRLLKAVPGSVLWLPSCNPDAEPNLSREAEKWGVAPARIIRAPRTNLVEEHLARLQCADLFLDTAPYNAHATCSDALWMGLPVITCVGESFPSRVAGSLLTALGMPDLITYSLDDYFALGLKLATDRRKYENIRKRILANRDSATLFDSPKFTRNLEDAYLMMWGEYMGIPNRGK